MSYLVLARRWRPQKFADLVGQDVVVRTLKNAIAGGNLAHAYLLCGIRGVGKTTIARLMAMAVNCQQPVDGEPCGTCQACLAIASGSSLDVQEMDAASHTGVDDVRDILDGVRYPPSSLKCKVYIIDEAHMLSKSAFNALLKTLEEPPAQVLFILATTESDKLPVTVRSRCQRFDLRSLGQLEIAAYLEHVFTTESIQADAEALAAIARAADGSVRDALSLAERVLAYSDQRLTAEAVLSALGLVGAELVCQLSEALFVANGAAAVQLLRGSAGRGHSPRALLLELSRLWHQLACQQVDDSLLGDEVDSAHRQWLQQYAGAMPSQALDLRYQVLLAGIRDLAIVDERLGAEMVLMRLCGLHALSPVSLPASESQSLRHGAPDSAKPVASAAKVSEPLAYLPSEQDEPVSVRAEAVIAKAAPIHEEPDLPMSDASSRYFSDWQQAVDAFAEVKPEVAAMFDHIVCLEFGAKVRLALDKHYERMISTTDRMAFAEWLGREVQWVSRQGQEGNTLSQERDRQARVEMARLRQNAEDDPHVQALMREMNAELVRVTPPGVETGDEQ